MKKSGMSKQLAATIRKPTLAATCRECPMFPRAYYICMRAHTSSPGEIRQAKNSKIIANRARLAEDWNLTAPADPYAAIVPLTDNRADWENVELYHDNGGGLVLVCSSGGRPPPRALGMQPIPPIYAIWYKSYAARFLNSGAMREALEQAQRERWGDEAAPPPHAPRRGLGRVSPWAAPPTCQRSM